MTSAQKKMLSPEVLEQATAELAGLAKQEGVRIALIGGFALQQYGSQRLTGDVDVVAERRIEALPRGPALSFGGEQTQSPNGVPVDMVLRDDDFASLYDDALARAKRRRGLPVPLVGPEHLAAMKMVAGRGRDMTDLEFLITSGALDRKKARKVIREHLGAYAAKEFERIVEEAEWKASRGRV